MSSVSQLRAMWEKKAMEDKQKANNNANIYKPLPNKNKNKGMINNDNIPNNKKQQTIQESVPKSPILIKQEIVQQPSKNNETSDTKRDQVNKIHEVIIDRQIKTQQQKLSYNEKSDKNQPSFILSNPISHAENISNNIQNPAKPINVKMMINSTNQDFIVEKNIYNANQNPNKMSKSYQTNSKQIQIQKVQQTPFEKNAYLQKAFNNYATRNQKKSGPSFLSFDQYD